MGCAGPLVNPDPDPMHPFVEAFLAGVLVMGGVFGVALLLSWAL